MALRKNINSYVNVPEADLYFEDRLDSTSWNTATETEKEQALVTATQKLDEMEWTGVAVSQDQTLAFPRVGSYYDPKYGMEITFGDTVPTRIINATYELAYHLLNNDAISDNTGDVQSIHVGPIKLINIKSAGTPRVVKDAISPMLINSGSNLWWRAN